MVAKIIFFAFLIKKTILTYNLILETEGTEMLRRIKNNCRTNHIPSVMLSTMANFYPTHSDNEKGAEVYLLIPFDGIELQEVLKNLNGLKHDLWEHYPSVTLSEITGQTERDSQFMQKILCLMETHIDDDQFGIKEVCEAMGMCRAQIYRKFKSLIDWTPHQYLRMYRLHKAKQLLLTTKLNVSETAYLTGFKNVSHFSRIFAEEFGKSPSEFSK